MYWKYFKYIIEHKWNVFIECMKMGMIIHAFTHDLSKFLPSEFFGYAKYFYHPDKIKNKPSYHKAIFGSEFDKSWNYHQKRNKHHWEYWVYPDNKHDYTVVPMPKRYMKHMIADWRAMSRRLGGSAKDWYYKNSHKMMLHTETIKYIDNTFWPGSITDDEGLI